MDGGQGQGPGAGGQGSGIGPGNPTAVLKYADRMGLVKRKDERRIRKSVRIGNMKTTCVVIECE